MDPWVYQNDLILLGGNILTGIHLEICGVRRFIKIGLYNTRTNKDGKQFSITRNITLTYIWNIKELTIGYTAGVIKNK